MYQRWKSKGNECPISLKPNSRPRRLSTLLSAAGVLWTRWSGSRRITRTSGRRRTEGRPQQLVIRQLQDRGQGQDWEQHVALKEEDGQDSWCRWEDHSGYCQELWRILLKEVHISICPRRPRRPGWSWERDFWAGWRRIASGLFASFGQEAVDSRPSIQPVKWRMHCLQHQPGATSQWD